MLEPISSPDHAEKCKGYLLSKHLNEGFSMEKEKHDCLPFLDLNNLRENKKPKTNAYRKKIFIGFYTKSKALYLK